MGIHTPVPQKQTSTSSVVCCLGRGRCKPTPIRSKHTIPRCMFALQNKCMPTPETEAATVVEPRDLCHKISVRSAVLLLVVFNEENENFLSTQVGDKRCFEVPKRGGATIRGGCYN